MQSLKILSMLVFAIFLVSTVTAFGIIGGAFDDGSVDGIQSITITEGDSINFNYDFISDSSPMTININLHDSLTGEIVIPFATNQVVTTPCSGLPACVCYTGEETIPSNINAGSYELIMTFSDNDGYSTSYTLYLIVEQIPDTTAPVITITSPEDGQTYDSYVTELTYTVTDEHLDSCWYSVDGGETTVDVVCNEIITGLQSVEGSNTWTVYAKDSYDNEASESVTFSVDTIAPVITILGDNPVEVLVGSTYVDAGATADDQEDGDITANIVVVNPVDVNTVGTYTITYNVQDSAGNSAVEITRTVNVVEDGNDTTAPVITIITPQATTYSAEEITFIISTDEPATAEYSLDGTENVAMSAEGTEGGDLGTEDPSDDLPGGGAQTHVYISEILTLSEGVHTVVFYATDAAGNMATSETVTFVIDLSTTAPTITVITPEQDKEYDESEITFEIEVDEIAEVTFSLNGGSEIAMDYQGISNGILTFTYTVTLSDGDHTVTFYATDTAGNTASATVEFSVDTSEDKDKKKKTTTNYYQTNYEEELYLNQFKNPRIIYLEDDDQPEKVLNWWQKFVEWLKRIFGFS